METTIYCNCTAENWNGNAAIDSVSNGAVTVGAQHRLQLRAIKANVIIVNIAGREIRPATQDFTRITTYAYHIVKCNTCISQLYFVKIFEISLLFSETL